MRLAAVFILLCADAWSAGQPGRGVASPSPSPDLKKAPAAVSEPASPVKTVEEPVFKLPELVIIGENQARIMAQKEQMAGTPLAGLHEAPLLEKEEGAVTALRTREDAPTSRTLKPGLSGLWRAEAGSHGLLSGAGWIGVQQAKKMRQADFYASTIRGEKAGTGNASGWNAGISAGAAEVAQPKAGGKSPFLETVMPWLRADNRQFGLGWRGAGRDLPYIGTASRTLNSGYLVAETARSSEGFQASALVNGTWIKSPAGNDRIFLLGEEIDIPIMSRSPLSVQAKARIQGETARFAGGGGLAGTDLNFAWIPDERWRFMGGVGGDIASSQVRNARSLRPLMGLSWTAQSGPTLSARFTGGLSVPWPALAAAEFPYSFFPSSPVPERELGKMEISAWQESWDGSRLRADVRFRELRDASSWFERPGEGLFTPAPVPRASIRELELSARINNWKPVSIYASAAWREVSTTRGLAIAGLANGNGRGGIEWAWRDFTIAAELEVSLVADRSILGGYLPPYESLGARAGWKPRQWLEVFIRGDNLTADRMERWGGYPEPKRLVSGGLTGTF